MRYSLSPHVSCSNGIVTANPAVNFSAPSLLFLSFGMTAAADTHTVRTSEDISSRGTSVAESKRDCVGTKEGEENAAAVAADTVLHSASVKKGTSYTVTCQSLRTSAVRGDISIVRAAHGHRAYYLTKNTGDKLAENSQ